MSGAIDGGGESVVYVVRSKRELVANGSRSGCLAPASGRHVRQRFPVPRGRGGNQRSARCRRVVQYAQAPRAAFGYLYDYRARAITADAYLGRLPEWLEGLSERLVTRGYFADLPDQVIANEYFPGQGISAHVDCVPCFDDTIISISLLSQCEMVFRECSSSRSLAVLLKPRSGILLKGAGRYDWTHEIPARKSDVVDGVKVERGRRISLTFRKVAQATKSLLR